jgi:ABC-2 type transport system permease protein
MEARRCIMNKYFDFELYKEAIRQTRVVGIILAVVFITISMIGEIGEMIRRFAVSGSHTWDHHLTFMEPTPMLWFFMYLAPLLLVMKVFAFLNKRSASDFYHGIPHNRKTLFISFLSGIMTWVVGTIMTLTILSAIIYIISPGVVLEPRVLVYTCLAFLAGTFLITAGLLLAKGLSGTGLTNIVTAAIILFYPRVILAIFNQVLMDITRVIHHQDTSILSNTNYNILFHFFLGSGTSLTHGTQEAIVAAPGVIIYTFILGLIYMVLAGVLFCKRKSEAAEMGAVNRIMQHVFRCLLIFPLTLLIPAILLEPFGVFIDFFAIVMIIFASLVIYFVYELIITRKMISLVNAIPALGIVVLANILFALLLIVGRNGVWNNVPVADEIAGIRIVSTSHQHQNSSYNELLTGTVYVNDPRSNEIIERTFRDNVNRVRSGEILSGPPMTFSIQMENGDTMFRSLRIYPDTAALIRESIRSDSEYLEKATRLPTVSEVTTISFRFDNGSTQRNINLVEELRREGVWEQAWEIYVAEFNRLSISEQAFHTRMIDASEESIITELGVIVVTGTLDNRRFVSNYPLSNLTPETLAFLEQAIDR